MGIEIFQTKLEERFLDLQMYMNDITLLLWDPKNILIKYSRVPYHLKAFVACCCICIYISTKQTETMVL